MTFSPSTIPPFSQAPPLFFPPQTPPPVPPSSTSLSCRVRDFVIKIFSSCTLVFSLIAAATMGNPWFLIPAGIATIALSKINDVSLYSSFLNLFSTATSWTSSVYGNTSRLSTNYSNFTPASAVSSLNRVSVGREDTSPSIPPATTDRVSVGREDTSPSIPPATTDRVSVGKEEQVALPVFNPLERVRVGSEEDADTTPPSTILGMFQNPNSNNNERVPLGRGNQPINSNNNTDRISIGRGNLPQIPSHYPPILSGANDRIPVGSNRGGFPSNFNTMMQQAYQPFEPSTYPSYGVPQNTNTDRVPVGIPSSNNSQTTYERESVGKK